MRGNRFFPGMLLIDYVLVLLFCMLLSLATGLLDQGNLEARDASAGSVISFQDADTPTNIPDPSPTATPTPTTAATETPTRRFTPTVEPTKAPYIFPRPFYTRDPQVSIRSY